MSASLVKVAAESREALHKILNGDPTGYVALLPIVMTSYWVIRLGPSGRAMPRCLRP